MMGLKCSLNILLFLDFSKAQSCVSVLFIAKLWIITSDILVKPPTAGLLITIKFNCCKIVKFKS